MKPSFLLNDNEIEVTDFVEEIKKGRKASTKNS
jgi:hypothetical protein